MYATTTYAYNQVGNLLSVTDTLGNVSTMTYDTLGRKLTMHDPDMGNWSYVYDANGNLTSQTDAKSQVLWFQYDALNRRVQKDFTTQKTLGSGDVRYTYDGTTFNRKGRLQQVVDAAVTVTFQYDALGRITQSAKTLDGTTYTTTSAYDGLGRLTSVSYPTSPVKTVTYTYDGPELKQVTEGATNYVTYAGWNALAQPGTATLGNGVVTTYSYANTNNATCAQQTFRLCTLKTQLGANPAYQDLRYGFDAAGNVQDLYDNTVANNAGDQHLTFDDLDRLTLANGPYGTSGANASITYEYDEIGNLTKNTQLSATAYTYPASGSSSVRPHAVTTAGANTYTYDNNGNMTGGAGRTLTWNLENKPLTVVLGGTTTTFVYDGDGGRVKKIVGSTTTRYISKLYECDNTNCSRFVWAGSTRIATIASNGTVNYWHGDHLGSSSIITDSAGTKVESITYYPYGGVRTNTSPSNPAIDVPYKYTGKELDASTGLSYYEARYYDAVLGRFISSDTLVPNPRDPQEFNRYSYAGNNPFRYTDPTGHWKCCNVGKFFRRALGDFGTTALGLGLQLWGGPLLGMSHFLAGGAVLTQSQSGRYIVAAEISAAAAITGTYALAPAVAPALGGTFGGALSGAVAGAGGSAANAGVAAAYGTRVDFGKAVLAGTVGGALNGLASGLGNMKGIAGVGLRMGLHGLAGGTTSQLLGGGFLKGFALSAASAGLSEGYRAYVGYDITIRPGGEAQCKCNGEDVIAGANNFARANVTPEMLENPGFWYEGGPVSQFGNAAIPAGSAIAGLHDVMNGSRGFGVFGEAANFATMPIAAAITYGGMIHEFAPEFMVDRHILGR